MVYGYGRSLDVAINREYDSSCIPNSFLKKALSMYDTHFLKLELFDDDDDDDDFSQQEVG